MNTIITILIFLIILVLIFSLLKSNKECNSCVLKEYDIVTNKNIEDTKFLFLSDFHNSDNKTVLDSLDEILEKDKNIEDIMSAGDMITYRPKRKRGILSNNFFKLLDICKKHSKRFLYGYGNHEDRFRLIDEIEKYKGDKDSLINFKNRLKDYNVEEIVNASYSLKENLKIYDIDYEKDFYKKDLFYKNIKNRLTDDVIKSLIGEIDKSKYNIILSHNPDYAERLIEYGFDLVLSGHQHGGLVRLPIIGAVISPELTLFPPYTSGHYKYMNKDIIVSAGLGEHTIKIRLNNLPEIIKINISKA